MLAISSVSPLSVWPVDWRPPATPTQQRFLGLASLAGRHLGIGVYGAIGAASGCAGSSDGYDVVDEHVLGLHLVSPIVLTHGSKLSR